MSLGLYLSAPIDQANPNAAVNALLAEAQSAWLEEEPNGWVFRPNEAFRAGVASGSPAIRDIDLFALSRADAVLAVLPAGTASVGVSMEIQRALDLGKPLVVFSDAPSWMLPPSSDRVYRVWADGLSDGVRYREVQDQMVLALSLALDDARVPGDSPVPTDQLSVLMLHPEAKLPSRAYYDDAGFDLFTSVTTEVGPGESADVPVDVAVQFPPGVWGYVIGRSSSWRNRGLVVHPGVLDTGYRGACFAGVTNTTNETVVIKAGERVAQLVLMPNVTANYIPVVVDRLAPGSRGGAGFGSSGL